MIARKKASILLYTLFVTTFMIAFFAAFQNDIRSMIARSVDKSAGYDSRSELAGAHDLLVSGQSAGTSSQYSFQKNGQDGNGISYLVGSGQRMDIPVKVFSTGALEFIVDAGSAPLDISYDSPLFSSGFALSGGESAMLSSISQSGTLSLSSLWGVSRASVRFSSAEPVQNSESYSLSRKNGQSKEFLGTFSIIR